MSRQNRPTIADVARESAVAKSTVSRALNGDTRVSAVTRARVEAVARRLGFRPSRSARSLKLARSMTLGVMLPDLENHTFVQYLKGVERAARQAGYSLLIADAEVSPQIQVRSLENLLDHEVDGLVLHRSFSRQDLLHSFVKAGVPFEMGHNDLESERQAAYGMFRYLIGLGHRRILYINRTRPDSAGIHPTVAVWIRMLEQAYADCLGAAPPEYIIEWADDRAHCREVVRRLLDGSRRPTTIVTGWHDLAAPTLATLTEMGIQIPNEISFVTWGDSDWTVAYRPPISVVRRDYQQEGESAVRALVAKIEGTHLQDEPPITWEFVKRQSCAAPLYRTPPNPEQAPRIEAAVPPTPLT